MLGIHIPFLQGVGIISEPIVGYYFLLGYNRCWPSVVSGVGKLVQCKVSYQEQTVQLNWDPGADEWLWSPSFLASGSKQTELCQVPVAEDDLKSAGCFHTAFNSSRGEGRL